MHGPTNVKFEKNSVSNFVDNHSL